MPDDIYDLDYPENQAKFIQTLKGRTIVEVVSGGNGNTVSCFDLYLDDGRRIGIARGFKRFKPLELFTYIKDEE